MDSEDGKRPAHEGVTTGGSAAGGKEGGSGSSVVVVATGWLSRVTGRGGGEAAAAAPSRGGTTTVIDNDDDDAAAAPRRSHPYEYRTYRRRWFGLAQLTLMNIVVSWDWLTYAPVAGKAATYYGVTESTINWISTAFFLAFVAVFPVTVAVLHRSVRAAVLTAAALLLVGNWVRYAGSRHRGGGSIACAMAGEIVIGFAQPFVLAAPTRYSDLWFTDRGRVAATAVASLANPLGAALGQLINPAWVSTPGDVSDMVLYVSIISSAVAVPAVFVPARPPTPVGPSSETPKLRLSESAGAAARSLEMWLVLTPFAVYVGFFNSVSSLLNQMMTPYGFTDDEAGIGGAVLIAAGLVAAAVSSPVLDRTKRFIAALRLLVPIVALSFLAFTWMPETRSVAGPYAVLAILGAASFSLVPVALELLTELTHPLSPEVTATTAWAGGQLLGAVFIIASDALVDGPDAHPPRNMKRALIFQAVLAMVTALLPLSIGLFGRRAKAGLRRIESDQRGRGGLPEAGLEPQA